MPRQCEIVYFGLVGVLIFPLFQRYTVKLWVAFKPGKRRTSLYNFVTAFPFAHWIQKWIAWNFVDVKSGKVQRIVFGKYGLNKVIAANDWRETNLIVMPDLEHIISIWHWNTKKSRCILLSMNVFRDIQLIQLSSDKTVKDCILKND